MENTVVANVMSYLRKKNVICKQQHGSLSGRSTTSNLLETIHDWTLTLTTGKLQAWLTLTLNEPLVIIIKRED